MIAQILDAGREMLAIRSKPCRMPAKRWRHLAGSYRLVLITKGDLFDQERKLAQSGLGDLFDAVEIVCDKTADTYTAHFRPPWRRAGARHDGGQFAEVRRGAGHCSGQLGRLSCRTS